MANFQKNELTETLEAGYKRACQEENADDAAYFARKIRDKLLAESDKELTFDRLGLAAPSGSTFTAWLSFLRRLGEALSGDWARYRKSLRDLPEQAGFPFNIQFPAKPGENSEEN